MATEIADVPRRRRAAARDLGRDVDDRDERQFHAAERLRLVETKQPGLVQQLLVLADQQAGVLGRLRAIAQRRHDLARAAQRLVVTDGGEVAADRLRQRADRTERACLHPPSRPNVPWRGSGLQRGDGGPLLEAHDGPGV